MNRNTLLTGSVLASLAFSTIPTRISDLLPPSYPTSNKIDIYASDIPKTGPPISIELWVKNDGFGLVPRLKLPGSEYAIFLTDFGSNYKTYIKDYDDSSIDATKSPDSTIDVIEIIPTENDTTISDSWYLTAQKKYGYIYSNFADFKIDPSSSPERTMQNRALFDTLDSLFAPFVESIRRGRPYKIFTNENNDRMRNYNISILD